MKDAPRGGPGWTKAALEDALEEWLQTCESWAGAVTSAHRPQILRVPALRVEPRPTCGHV